MEERYIIDAHLHVGRPGMFFIPQTEPDDLLILMDRVGISHAICMDHRSIWEGCGSGLEAHHELFERSEGRIHYLGVFHPRDALACLAALECARGWPGFAGIKLHPSIHKTPADDPAYEPAWAFAAQHDLTILTHSWSVSPYNPVQYLSTPERFEKYVRRFPQVRFVLGHAGGRGTGRHEAIRMANEYANVFLDFAGDVFCYGLIESLVKSVPLEKILFGSDFPWLDPRANILRVLLAEIEPSAKIKILRDNAIRAYQLGVR